MLCKAEIGTERGLKQRLRLELKRLTHENEPVTQGELKLKLKLELRCFVRNSLTRLSHKWDLKLSLRLELRGAVRD